MIVVRCSERRSNLVRTIFNHTPTIPSSDYIVWSARIAKPIYWPNSCSLETADTSAGISSKKSSALSSLFSEHSRSSRSYSSVYTRFLVCLVAYAATNSSYLFLFRMYALFCSDRRTRSEKGIARPSRPHDLHGNDVVRSYELA